MTFTRTEFLAWLALLAAAEEQPFPTAELKRAIAALTSNYGGMTGHHHSPETRAKMSASARARRARCL